MAIQVTQKQMSKILENYKQPIESTGTVNLEKGEGNMNNKLTDLNNYLFEQLERLNDDSLDEGQLDKEIKRANAVTQIATNIVKNADVMLKGAKYLSDKGIVVNDYSTALMIGMGNEKKDGKV